MFNATVHNYGNGTVNICMSDQNVYHFGDGTSYSSSTRNSRHRSFTAGDFHGNGNGGYTYSYSFSSGPRMSKIITSSPGSFPLPAITKAPLRPSNFLYVRQINETICGNYKIDPTLAVPRSLLSGIAASIPASERSNLHLETQNGTINANVRLVQPCVASDENVESIDSGDKDSGASTDIGNQVVVYNQRRRATLTFYSVNGAIVARIDPRDPRPRFRLLATSHNGSITLHIPRTFHGPITMTSHNGQIRVTPDLKNGLTIINDGPITKKCFLGDMTGYDTSSTDGQDNWDEIVVESHNGGVGICFAHDTTSYDNETSVVEGDEEVNVRRTRRTNVHRSNSVFVGMHTVYHTSGGGFLNTLFSGLRF